MAWPEAIIGAIGALVGVGVGSWVTGRSEATLAARAGREARRRDLEGACTEVGAAFRMFGRFVRNQPMSVELIERPADDKATELIRDASPPWEAVDQALARLEILVQADSDLWRAADNLRRQLWPLIRSRATYDAGAIPNAVYRPFKDAQAEFAKVARGHLDAML